jgi:asparagine synthase (glutamine-hydrolysing)
VYDESAHAALVAQTYGCEHHPVGLSAVRAAGEIDEAVAALDQPSADGINTYFVARATRQAGITVALSGLGGDELFAGYHHFRNFATLMRWRPMLMAAGWLRGPRLDRQAKALNVPRLWLKGLALATSGGEAALAYRGLRSMFAPAEVAAFLGGAGERPDDGVYVPPLLGDRLSKRDPVTAFGALELANYLRNTLLRDTDVMSMASALEVRVPFLDHKVVELAMAIPGEMKTSGSVNKALLAAVVPSLPPSTIRRRKMGFTLPFDSWFRGRLRPWMEERLLGRGLRDLGILATSEVETIWRQYLDGKGVSHARVWCLAALADWCQRHRVRA